jgi:hypothetical protein
MFFRCILIFLALLIASCSSVPEVPEFIIEKQTLHTKRAETGKIVFVFILKVKSKPVMQIDSTKPMSKRELKQFAQYQRIEDSPELKLALEDLAVEKLKVKLVDQSHCQSGHKIDEVYWRKTSVQLRGYCL